MVVNLAYLQALAAIVLSPVFLSMIGDGLAAVLAQDGFPQLLNDLIAWVVLIAAALASMFAANQFVPSMPAIANAFIAAVFLLANGSMGKLKPYLLFLNWLQSNVFDVAGGASGKVDVSRLNSSTLVSSLVNALLPEVEKIVAKYAQAIVGSPRPSPVPARPAQSMPAIINAAPPTTLMSGYQGTPVNLPFSQPVDPNYHPPIVASQNTLPQIPSV